MTSMESKSLEFSRWDEDQCEAGLTHLEQLRDQLDVLRSSIHSIIQPLIAVNLGSQEHFNRLKQTVEAEYSRVGNFQAIWQSAPVAEVLDYTLRSAKLDPDPSKGAKLPEDGQVQEGDQISRGASEPNEDKNHVNDAAGHKVEDMAQAIEDFKQRHPECTVDFDSQEQKTEVSVPGPLGPTNFTVKKRQGSHNEEVSWDVECLGTMKLFPAITRCLASRPQDNNLHYTLEMIAAYRDARRAPCVACGQIVDKKAQTAPARRSKMVKTENEEGQEVWEAFHEGCLQ